MNTITWLDILFCLFSILPLYFSLISMVIKMGNQCVKRNASTTGVQSELLVSLRHLCLISFVNSIKPGDDFKKMSQLFLCQDLEWTAFQKNIFNSVPKTRT